MGKHTLLCHTQPGALPSACTSPHTAPGPQHARRPTSPTPGALEGVLGVLWLKGILHQLEMCTAGSSPSRQGLRVQTGTHVSVSACACASENVCARLCVHVPVHTCFLGPG